MSGGSVAGLQCFRRCAADSFPLPRSRVRRSREGRWRAPVASGEGENPSAAPATLRCDRWDDRPATVSDGGLVNRQCTKQPPTSCSSCDGDRPDRDFGSVFPVAGQAYVVDPGAPSVHPLIACICCCRVLTRGSQLTVAYGASVPLTYHRWSLQAERVAARGHSRAQAGRQSGQGRGGQGRRCSDPSISRSGMSSSRGVDRGASLSAHSWRLRRSPPGRRFRRRCGDSRKSPSSITAMPLATIAMPCE